MPPSTPQSHFFSFHMLPLCCHYYCFPVLLLLLLLFLLDFCKRTEKAGGVRENKEYYITLINKKNSKQFSVFECDRHAFTESVTYACFEISACFDICSNFHTYAHSKEFTTLYLIYKFSNKYHLIYARNYQRISCVNTYIHIHTSYTTLNVSK